MRTYRNDMPHAAFPIGGIGTGTISLLASGRLDDFQLFNRPSLGLKIPYSFFSMYTCWGNSTDARALEAESAPDFYKGRGYHPSYTMDLPKFKTSEMSVRYPFANIAFHDDAFPFKVTLEAYNPFIPSCADDSGIPGAIFHFDVENTSGQPAVVLIASSMGSIHNYTGTDCFDNHLVSEHCENREVRESDMAGVFMTGSAVPKDALTYANNAILTPDANAELKPYWYRGGWYDGVTDFWNHFREGKLNTDPGGDSKFSVVGPAGNIVGSVGVRKVLQPGDVTRFTFVISWYVPNRFKGWSKQDNAGQTMKNYYSHCFTDAVDVGRTLIRRMDALEDSSRRFTDALYATTMPEPFVDAIASNLAVLRSTTCWRAPDGTFVAWEGSHEQEGSCNGTCTHVWNYAQTVASLFPDLEKSARLNEYLRETDAEGKMTFRCSRIFDLPGWQMYPAVDGQFGTIMRTWREYKLSGDRNYLETVYPIMLSAFDFGLRTWDPDGDGVPEASQHNTYDIEFYGVNPLSAVMLLGAEQAVIAMAKEMGDIARVRETEALFEKTGKNFDRLCWQGEFYVQRSEDINRHPYQFGDGCLSDQLFGQTMAYLAGLGDLLPAERLDSSIASIYKYNFQSGDERDTCLQRLYLAKDETGLVLCSWPNGNVPRFPFVYSNEVWTGIEYQVATLMVYRGMIDEAVNLVKTVRARFDGIRRSPWSEMECGFYYARAMASWGLLIAMSGFDCNMNKGWLKFNPVEKTGTTFWSVGGCWGYAAFAPEDMQLSVSFGKMTLKTLNLPRNFERITLNGADVEFDVVDGEATFRDALVLTQDDVLKVAFAQ